MRFVCILMSILYRQSMMAPFVSAKLVLLHCLQIWGFRVMVWSGCWVILRPCPLCPVCPPGFLPDLLRCDFGLFHIGSFEGGVELFLLFRFRRASRSAIFCVITCNWLCRVRIMSISSFLLSFSKSDRCVMLTQSTTELTLCKQCAHQPLKKDHPTE